MNRDFRLVALVAATLGLLVSLFFALRPDGGDDAGVPVAAGTTTEATLTQATTAPEPAPATTATEPPPATTAETGPLTITLEVPGDRAPEVRKLSVPRGREVRLVVRSELADEIHVHGYDLSADVAPGEPATIDFTADAPGRFEIELESRGLQIAELEVGP